MRNIERPYEKQKRNRIDKCNICGQVSDLTWDHVPPKFCLNKGKVKFNSILELHEKEDRYRVYQNGIRYRTICSNCNNNILGSNYDKEYQKFVEMLIQIYSTKGNIGQYIDCKGIKINKLARAIVGHFLAAREVYNDGKLENELRMYFLNPKALPPQGLSLYYYVYLYNSIMIIRDIVPKKFGHNEYMIPDGLMSCLNAFPIAFILTNESKSSAGLFNLLELCSPNIEEEKNVKIDMYSFMYPNRKKMKDPYWPCNVSDEETGTSLILAGDESQNSIFTKGREIK